MYNFPYLKDTQFLKEIDKVKNKQQFVKITVLDWQERPLQNITGKVIDGNINLDGSSAMRRTANITLFADNTNNDLTNIDNLISINKKIEVLIGFSNDFNKYKDFPILWFPQGIFLIVSPSISRSLDGVKISLTLHDKMALLNGECGGVIPAAVNFHEVENTDDYGNVTVSKPTIVQIIQELVNHFGGQQLGKIIIKDLKPTVKQVLKWNGATDNPLYVCKSDEQHISIVDDDPVSLYKKIFIILCKQYSATKKTNIDAETFFNEWIKSTNPKQLDALKQLSNKIEILQKRIETQEQNLKEWENAIETLKTELNKRDNSLIAQVKTTISELSDNIQNTNKKYFNLTTAVSPILSVKEINLLKKIKPELKLIGKTSELLQQTSQLRKNLYTLKNLASAIKNEKLQKNDSDLPYNVIYKNSKGETCTYRVVSQDYYNTIAKKIVKKPNLQYIIASYNSIAATLFSLPPLAKNGKDGLGNNYKNFYSDNGDLPAAPNFSATGYKHLFAFPYSPKIVFIKNKSNRCYTLSNFRTQENTIKTILNQLQVNSDVRVLSTANLKINDIDYEKGNTPFYFCLAEFIKIRNYFVSNKMSKKLDKLPKEHLEVLTSIEKEINVFLNSLYNIKPWNFSYESITNLIQLFIKWCNETSKIFNAIKQIETKIITKYKEILQALLNYPLTFNFSLLENKDTQYQTIITLIKNNSISELQKYYSTNFVNAIKPLMIPETEKDSSQIKITEKIEKTILKYYKNSKEVYQFSFLKMLQEGLNLSRILVNNLPYQENNYTKKDVKIKYEEISQKLYIFKTKIQQFSSVFYDKEKYFYLSNQDKKILTNKTFSVVHQWNQIFKTLNLSQYKNDFQKWKDDQQRAKTHKKILETISIIDKAKTEKNTYYNQIIEKVRKKIKFLLNEFFNTKEGKEMNNVKFTSLEQIQNTLNNAISNFEEANKDMKTTQAFEEIIKNILNYPIETAPINTKIVNAFLDKITQIPLIVPIADNFDNEKENENKDIKTTLYDFKEKLNIIIKEARKNQENIIKSKLSQSKIEQGKTGLQKFFKNPTAFIKKYQALLSQIQQYKNGQDVGYELTDFTYPGTLTANAGETVTSILQKIKNTLGNFEYYYDINGYFIFQEIKNYLNKSFSSYILQSANSANYNYNLIDGKTVYNFSNEQIIKSYQSTPQYQNIKNDFIVWGERKTAAGQKFPIRYHLAIDYKPSINSVYCFECPAGYSINNSYRTFTQLPNEGSKKIYYYVQEDNAFYEWIQQTQKNEKININLDQINNSIFFGYKKILPPIKNLEYIMEPYSSFIKQNRFKAENIKKEFIDNDLINWENSKKTSGKYKKVFYEPKTDRYLQLKIDKISGKWNATFYILVFPRIRKCIVINDLISVNLPQNKKYKQENIYFYCKDKQCIYTYNSKINKMQPKKNITAFVVNDYRTELLLDGIQNEKMGLSTNDYYSELKNEWTKIYNLFPVVAKNTPSSTGRYYKDIKTSPTNMNYYLDLLSSAGLIAQYGISTIGKRTQVISNNNINCIFEPVCPEIYFLNKNQPINLNQSVDKQKQQRDQLKKKRNEYIKTYKHWIKQNAIFQNSSLVQVDNKIYQKLVLGGVAHSAYDEIRAALYQYLTYNESISISTLPIYYLEPNSLITINDSETNIKGNYMIKSISLPLGIEGTMNLSCTKVIERI